MSVSLTVRGGSVHRTDGGLTLSAQDSGALRTAAGLPRDASAQQLLERVSALTTPRKSAEERQHPTAAVTETTARRQNNLQAGLQAAQATKQRWEAASDLFGLSLDDLH